MPSWRRVLLVWMLIMLLETLHGMAREIFIAPVLGDMRARQLGVLLGSVIVLAVALLTVHWMGAHSRRAQLWTGAFWVAMTVVFEIVLGRATGASWERIFSDCNPARGGFMIAGLVAMFLSPMLAAKLRRASPGETP
jgi:membrane-associated HD superfamily phosphohydrolase